ncbi:MAG: hypothetical protein ABSE62_06985 [Chthoniobacteraceae bacterium]
MLALAMAGKAQAQSTWTGATDANWADANWSTTPTSGVSLVFGAAGTGGTTLTDNLTAGAGSWTIPSITFNSSAAAFTINPLSSANAFTLTTGITDDVNSSSNVETIGDNIAYTGGLTFTMTGGDTIDLTGNLTTRAFSI